MLPGDDRPRRDATGEVFGEPQLDPLDRMLPPESLRESFPRSGIATAGQLLVFRTEATLTVLLSGTSLVDSRLESVSEFLGDADWDNFSTSLL